MTDASYITQTIRKPAGYGPYLWVVVWRHQGKPYDGQLMTTVFAHHTPARGFGERIEANGHEVLGLDLGVDRTHECPDCGQRASGVGALCGICQGGAA